VTGLGHEAERRRAMSAGYDLYLMKPFDRIELVDLVTKVLGRTTWAAYRSAAPAATVV